MIIPTNGTTRTVHTEPLPYHGGLIYPRISYKSHLRQRHPHGHGQIGEFRTVRATKLVSYPLTTSSCMSSTPVIPEFSDSPPHGLMQQVPQDLSTICDIEASQTQGGSNRKHGGNSAPRYNSPEDSCFQDTQARADVLALDHCLIASERSSAPYTRRLAKVV